MGGGWTTALVVDILWLNPCDDVWHRPRLLQPTKFPNPPKKTLILDVKLFLISFVLVNCCLEVRLTLTYYLRVMENKSLLRLQKRVLLCFALRFIQRSFKGHSKMRMHIQFNYIFSKRMLFLQTDNICEFEKWKQLSLSLSLSSCLSFSLGLPLFLSFLPFEANLALFWKMGKTK